MDAVLHKQICEYIKNGTLPPFFNSTKANFVAKTKKYKLNDNEKLTRNLKPCVLLHEKQSIFDALHSNKFY